MLRDVLPRQFVTSRCFSKTFYKNGSKQRKNILCLASLVAHDHDSKRPFLLIYSKMKDRGFKFVHPSCAR